MAKVMTVNSGSSSLKFKLYEMPEEKAICSGNCERIGEPTGVFTIKFNGNKEVTNPVFRNHGEAAKAVLEALVQKGIIASFDEIKAIGHRVVQGGQYYSDSVLFDEKCVERVKELTPLAPLHNGANLTCYNAFKEVLPDTPAVAVFDTAFHQTMAPEDYTYPIPYELTEKYGIRRYGFHGTSHKYLSLEAAKLLNGKKDAKVISCHLGSGASICAIRDGKCVATSMGMTPLGGIMMGTRTGDMDPSVFNYVCQVTGKSPKEVDTMFNKKSGFLGVSEKYNDSRDIIKGCAEGDKQCILANAMFNRRVADFVGQYYVRLGGADLIIFSAGIGENEPLTRQQIVDDFSEALGAKLDNDLNYKCVHGEGGVISAKDSKILVAVIPTDEEVMIARDAYHIGLGK